jgi:SAM-dependent methyltransferase
MPTSVPASPIPTRIDLGCGKAKREGFIGVDSSSSPGVDHVVDLTRERLPFPDASVSHVYSSHFLEHIAVPNHIFMEIARVCTEGAKIEFWMPYGFSNEAFLYGHAVFLTEEPWLHFCVRHRDHHLGMLGGRWLLNSINYVVLPGVEKDLARQRTPLPFAIKYLKNVVHEFGVEITFTRTLATPAIQPIYTVSQSRFGKRVPLR